MGECRCRRRRRRRRRDAAGTLEERDRMREKEREERTGLRQCQHRSRDSSWNVRLIDDTPRAYRANSIAPGRNPG